MNPTDNTNNAVVPTDDGTVTPEVEAARLALAQKGYAAVAAVRAFIESAADADTNVRVCPNTLDSVKQLLGLTDSIRAINPPPVA